MYMPLSKTNKLYEVKTDKSVCLRRQMNTERHRLRHHHLTSGSIGLLLWSTHPLTCGVRGNVEIPQKILIYIRLQPQFFFITLNVYT